MVARAVAVLVSATACVAFQPGAALAPFVVYQLGTRAGKLASAVPNIAARAGMPQLMAGFGTKPKKAKDSAKKAALSPKKQWDRFKDLVKGGAPRVAVYARVRGTDAWTRVGDVACSSGVTPVAAAALHKRLVLEHAVRVAPQLAPKARELECGYAAAGDGAPILLEKTEPAAMADAGFEGLPDASARYGGQTASEAVNLEFGLQGKTVG